MVEFLGLPGCGKSTYIKNLPLGTIINPLDLIYSDNHLIQNLNKFPLIVGFIFSHPTISYKISQVMLSINYSTFYRRVKMFSYLFSTLGAIDKCKRKYSSQKICIDEGVNQVLAFVQYESVNSAKLIEKLWHMLIPFMADKIVYIDMDYETIKHRLLQRKDSHGSEVRKDIIENPQAIQDADDCIHHVLSLIRMHGLPVVAI